LSTGWGLWWWEDRVATPGYRLAVMIGLVIVLGFLASWLLIGDLAGSKIGLTDENDLAQYVGSRGYVAFSDIPHLLAEKTEVGQFGQGQRFRPFYYLSRITETTLWGLDGRSWYRWRIVMFGMVIATMLWFYSQYVGLVLGGIIAAYTLSFWMWADIWARSTGTNEQYSSVGLALFALGAWFFVKRWHGGTTLLAPSIAMAVGAIIAMGSKENMLLLEVPLGVALLAGLWRGRIGWGGAVTLVVAIAFGAWIASAIIVYFLGAKVEDIYGNSLHGSLLRSKWMVLVYKGVVITAVGAAAIDLLLGKVDRELRGQYRSLAWKNILYATIIAVVFIFNFLFYTGRIPGGSRYDFPGVLALPALLILLLKIVGETAGVFGFGIAAKKATGLVLAMVLVVYSATAPWTLPAAAKEAVARNSAFAAGLQEAKRITHEHPQWPIFVESFSYLDYEPVQALAFFFIANSINNPRYLVYVVNPYGEPRSEFESSLDRVLVSESSKGLAERGYSPLGDAMTGHDGDCFAVILRKPDQFAIDRANGIDPIAAKHCVHIPPLLYWEKGDLRFDPPSR
jgi:hypothetical protein